MTCSLFFVLLTPFGPNADRRRRTDGSKLVNRRLEVRTPSPTPCFTFLQMGVCGDSFASKTSQSHSELPFEESVHRCTWVAPSDWEMHRFRSLLIGSLLLREQGSLT